MRKLLYALTIVGLWAGGLLAQQAGGAFIPSFGYEISGAWTFTQASPFVFEGATSDDSEFTLAVPDVTADVTGTIPTGGNSSFAFFVSSLTTNNLQVANSVWGASNALVFEGATADAFELTLSPADVAADRTVTIPDMGAASVLLASTLTTNTVGAANSVWGITNGFTFEGATADTAELTLSPADATADATVTIPALTGNVAVMASIVAGGTETVAAVSHAGACIQLDQAGGSVITLPAATGSGDRYCFVIAATSASHQINVVGNDEFVGGIIQGNDSDNTVVMWPAADAGDNDRIAPNGTSRGGVVGARYDIIDGAADNWTVIGYSDASGTEATPFVTGQVS